MIWLRKRFFFFSHIDIDLEKNFFIFWDAFLFNELDPCDVLACGVIISKVLMDRHLENPEKKKEIIKLIHNPTIQSKHDS